MSTFSVTTCVRDASHLGGGMVGVARPVHSGMVQLGAQAAFVSGNAPEQPTENSRIVGLDGSGFPSLPNSSMQAVVHIHGIWTPFEFRAYREARRRHARIVISPHGALEPWAFNHKPTKKRIAWWLYQRAMMRAADLIVVNSPQEFRRMRELGLSGPVATIPNGVDMEGFVAASEASERDRIVLFFSRIDAKKGIPDLIAAWSAIPDHNGYRLVIMGHGEAPYVQHVSELVAASAASNIALLPPLYGAERWDMFAKASVYALPSYSENFGITVAEALMAGLPVITTKATPWSELGGLGLGWIIDNDVAQLRQALISAIGLLPPALSDIRTRAHIYASERFSWQTIVERYAQTYDWLLHSDQAAPEWVHVG